MPLRYTLAEAEIECSRQERTATTLHAKIVAAIAQRRTRSKVAIRFAVRRPLDLRLGTERMVQLRLV
jgi:hypothetical protein